MRVLVYGKLALIATLLPALIAHGHEVKSVDVDDHYWTTASDDEFDLESLVAWSPWTDPPVYDRPGTDIHLGTQVWVRSNNDRTLMRSGFCAAKRKAHVCGMWLSRRCSSSTLV